MPQPLWKIRQRKGLSVNQLAAKSGVPAISIREYESGQAIRAADLPKLAKALYVEEWDIEIKSESLSKGRTVRPAHSRPPTRHPAPRPKRAPPTPPSARSSQIEHLLTLVSRHFDKDQTTLEREIGKPLEELTRNEASNLLAHYQKQMTGSSPDRTPEETRAKRRRAYLPEGVDEFELQYLTAQQEEKALLHFTLFNGEQVSGRIIGFSPYSITVEDDETEEEVTLQKLAIAYYRRVGGEG